ncbi:hypothetical protein BYT27DRAFT_6655174 [Phlegmacium glaucopus]|nr:hypothetical protein BYT27DRAFT_6655174 [Phlegmacium glaucopus]
MCVRPNLSCSIFLRICSAQSSCRRELKGGKNGLSAIREFCWHVGRGVVFSGEMIEGGEQEISGEVPLDLSLQSRSCSSQPSSPPFAIRPGFPVVSVYPASCPRLRLQ